MPPWKSTLIQPDDFKKKIPYAKNSLSFKYGATFYELATQTRFSYQLESLKKSWSDWSTKNEKEFTNIPEGSYCFCVKAKNIYDWESDVARYHFSIQPPWHRTILAYFGYLVTFALLMFAGIRLNTRRLITVQKKLEKIVQERTEQVVRQKDELIVKNKEIEEYAADLYTSNRHLTEARNALWGEMELAKKIQTVLLPQQPLIPGYEIVAYMKPADEVGGDYYDVIHIDGTDWVVIGDVSGHGVPAGLVMMMVQTSIRSVLQERQNPSTADILKLVNRVIHENIQKLGEDKYMTITLMSIQENGLIYFSGLHQDIMIYRSAQQTVELVETKGIWIGLMDEIEGIVQVDQLTLQPGDTILLYTDGITEAVGPDGQMFSEEKLNQLFQTLGDHPPATVKDGILQALTGYTCSDDITLLVIHRTSENHLQAIIPKKIFPFLPSDKV